jgi:hypothetical protein
MPDRKRPSASRDVLAGIGAAIVLLFSFCGRATAESWSAIARRRADLPASGSATPPGASPP